MESLAILDQYRLSNMQKGMLFHSISAGLPGTDIEQIVLTLPEEVIPNLLRDAWQDVVNRHTSLRASFTWDTLEEPQQEIQESLQIPFSFEDWREISREDQQEKLIGFLENDRGRAFILSNAPLLRVSLIQLDTQLFKCIWTFHHILLDGRAFPIILNEVFSFYEAKRKNEIALLPTPPIFRSYIEWLYEQDQSEAEGFWRRLLQGFNSPTPLPTSHYDSSSESIIQQRYEKTIKLSEVTTKQLHMISAQQGFTLNSCVQGAWSYILSQYSGEKDVIFGAVRACRHATVPDADRMVGLFSNTLPMRIFCDPNARIVDWIGEIRDQHVSLRAYENTALMDIQNWSEVPHGASLFDSIIVFENHRLDSVMKSMGENWKNRQVDLLERTTFPITLNGYAEDELLLKIAYDHPKFEHETIERMLGHLRIFLEHVAENPELKLAEVSILTEEEKERILDLWNSTATPYPEQKCIHDLIEEQAKRTPNAIAVSCLGQKLTYRELSGKTNRFANYLISKGVGPDTLVGVYMDRSIEMMVSLLAILKAGGAYVPLDPSFPADRIAFMLDDAQIQYLITQESLLPYLPSTQARIIVTDSLDQLLKDQDDDEPECPVQPNHLAYVIYTSGSTGKPKGVMVEHRNVMNFFTGMDQRVGSDNPGVWLAVTSISFDISVLELFWTLARGFTVVIHAESKRPSRQRKSNISKPIDFSLFYFASANQASREDCYRLLLEGAKYADENGFSAIWTPERHFHDFGGIFPNPSVTSAVLAGITKRIHLRAGSVVSPLHHPVRIAEEWSFVDNISKGRVGISFASGWHIQDFALKPENYPQRKQIMYDQIELVRKLWRGESFKTTLSNGSEAEVRITPRPIQPELPTWVTAASNPKTFEEAGEIGANVLTHLLGQSVDDLRDKIEIYRKAWRDHGHEGQGHVTILLHTFVGMDEDRVRETVRQPMKDYLRSASELIKSNAWAFPVIADRVAADGVDIEKIIQNMSAEEFDALLDYSFERYYEKSGLFGTPESCLQRIDQLKEVGVDEVACLIDFGVSTDEALSNLVNLNQLRECSQSSEDVDTEPDGVAEWIQKYEVTHLQCTPSMAKMLTADEAGRTALNRLECFLIGGEAFPTSLASDLRKSTSAKIINMYGPTETTIWSSTHPVERESRTIPIGKPIANTQFYILNSEQKPVPVGVEGELYIGGAGVVRGYLNRPELTQEKFIPNPFQPVKSPRLYRTGDSARYRSDGTVEFLGRKDFQVKIRGYRIELEEIENALHQYSAIREAVVVPKQDALDDVRLIAYLIPQDAGKIQIEELRSYLSDKLPEYMIPSNYIIVSEFPLTPNGKIDRKALPALENIQSFQIQQREEAEPEDHWQKTLLEIWRSVLKTQNIGIHDNFFEAGGHSLLAIQLNARIREAFQVELPLGRMLKSPTIAALAEMVQETQINSADEESLASALENLENLSEEEVQAMLKNYGIE